MRPNSASFRRLLLLMIVVCLAGGDLSGQDFQRVLIPIFIPVSLKGAYGSVWSTEIYLKNRSDVAIFAFQSDPAGCRVTCPDPVPSIPPNALIQLHLMGSPTTANPGVNYYIESAFATDVTLSARLVESSGEDEQQTEIPIVRESRFLSGTSYLLNIPRDSGKRLMLRVYDPYNNPGGEVRVRVHDSETDELLQDTFVSLTPETNTYYPSSFDDLPAFGMLDIAVPSADRTAYVEIDPLDPGMRYWAFLTITDNASQHVTLVTPE